MRETYWDSATLPDQDVPSSSRQHTLRAVVPQNVAERLEKATRGNAVLLHTVVTSALAACFAANSGHASVTLGVPALRGDEIGTQELTVLPVALDLSPEAALKDVLALARRSLTEAYAHQECGYAWLSERLRLPEETVHGEESRCPVAGWAVRHPKIHRQLPDERFDGVVTIEAGSTGVVLEFSVDGRTPQHAMEQLAEQVITVAGQFVTEPAAPLKGLRRLSPELRARALHLADGGPAPDPVSVVELFRAAAAAHPDRAAIVGATGTLTYRELVDRVDRIGAGLQAAGAPDLIALAGGDTADTVACALAALQSGLLYVVVDAQAVGDTATLRERGVTLTVTAGSTGAPGECTAADLEAAGSSVAGERPAQPGPDTPAYTIFTSGSTGTAKAITVTHGNLAASNAARRAVYGTAPERFLLLSPLIFDSSVAGLYWTLTGGGTLHIPGAETVRDPAALVAYAEEHRVDVTLGLPRLLESAARIARPGALASLRTVIGAGEHFPAALAGLLTAAAPEAKVVNEYGPTEATVWATWHDVTGEEKTVPIGRPVPGTRVYVLDASGEPVSPGMIGQLAIGGPQIALGYDDADLTAARFVTDPFAATPARLHLTGDYGWADLDGTLHFIGRRDHETKVRGRRIHLGDVSAALRMHPAVADAEALVHRGELIAFLSPADPAQAPTSAILTELPTSLSQAATPTRVIPVSEIPRLPNGKVRVRPLVDRLEQAECRQAMSDPLDALVLEQFRAVLRNEGVGSDDDFFASGGDSIKAALLIGTLSKRLGTYLYIVALMDHPTAAGLAAYLREQYADAVAALLAEHPGMATPTGSVRAAKSAVADVEAERQLRALLETVSPPAPQRPQPLRRSPVFVLAPPRSGSTLLRILLGGHPQLFSPPEVMLLQFASLAERRDALTGGHEFYREGLMRAVMALDGTDADAAEALLDRAADEGWSSQRMYAWLMERAGDRLLVDKTTEYALDPAVLRRAEEYFEAPLYIHLTRDPRACVNSFVETRMDQAYLRAEHSFAPGQLAELIWRISHDNISAFLEGVDQSRVFRVAFEDFVADPAAISQQMSAFLGVDFDSTMLDVYGDSSARMTDGVKDGGRMLGDLRFHEHKTIDPAVADRWRTKGRDIHLTASTRALARELGYDDGGRALRSVLSSDQARTWFMEQLHPESGAYNVPLALAGHGPLDVTALHRALNSVVRRHHAYRSLIELTEDGPSSRFAPHLAAPLTVEDVPGAVHQDRVQELAFTPFDLSRESALRLHLLRDGERFTLLFVVHHVAGDAASLGILVEDFFTAYTSWCAQTSPRLTPLPEQPSDLVRDREQDEVQAKRSLERAIERLKGMPTTLTLPPVRERDEWSQPRVHFTTVAFPAHVADAVRKFSTERRCTLYRTLLSVFSWTLRSFTGDTDFCVGTPVSRRTPQQQGLIGMFVNTAVLRLKVDDGASFDDLVERANLAARDAIADADVSLEDLVTSLDAGREARFPLVEALFAVQELDFSLDRWPDLGMRQFLLTPRYAKFEISVIVTDKDGELTARVELAEDRFTAQDADRLAERFVADADRLTVAPHQPVGPLDEAGSLRSHDDK
ncbi:non-ribosomal peptide synthetase [Streptomyces sp. CC219B]|uniref:non-ribosomal peptide synthetase n=1 Tax=Streptomyces sp. CC219B TaxID=3044574 RepID=UPI0024A90018|nr:non-ribosomal peptide synthetase [Streptomyces sp. CC219B]